MVDKTSTYLYTIFAEVVELADTRGLSPRARKGVGVRIPSSVFFC